MAIPEVERRCDDRESADDDRPARHRENEEPDRGWVSVDSPRPVVLGSPLFERDRVGGCVEHVHVMEAAQPYDGRESPDYSERCADRHHTITWPMTGGRPSSTI